jgi:hypothetical protein
MARSRSRRERIARRLLGGAIEQVAQSRVGLEPMHEPRELRELLAAKLDAPRRHHGLLIP